MIFESKVLVAFDQRGVTASVLARGGRPQARVFAPLSEGALVVSALEENLVRPDEVRAALQHVHRELGGNGRRAALVLPDGVARLALLEVPRNVRPAELARFRLAASLPYAASEALIDGVAAPPASFLAAAVRRMVVRGYEAAATAAGFGQERVDLAPLLQLAPLLRHPEQLGTVLALVLGDVAYTLAYFDGRGLALLRNRRRDTSEGEYGRLRDELLRTAAQGGASGVPGVIVLGADVAGLKAALREEGWSVGAEPAGAASGWAEASPR